MRIAILMSNTDESDFAAQHPRDGEKWRDLLAPLCPDCDFTVYAVKDGHFPADIRGYDAAVITGSPASVHDLDPWLQPLFALIRDAVTHKVPLFGACFGHQAIALALGGTVTDNPDGWVFGTTETKVLPGAKWFQPGPLRQFAAHSEQVTNLPDGAVVIMGNAECPIGGFAIGDHVLTTQYHPEMTVDFITALIEFLADDKPADVIEKARASLSHKVDNGPVAATIMAFLRQDTP